MQCLSFHIFFNYTWQVVNSQSLEATLNASRKKQHHWHLLGVDKTAHQQQGSTAFMWFYKKTSQDHMDATGSDYFYYTQNTFENDYSCSIVPSPTLQVQVYRRKIQCFKYRYTGGRFVVVVQGDKRMTPSQDSSIMYWPDTFLAQLQPSICPCLHPRPTIKQNFHIKTIH